MQKVSSKHFSVEQKLINYPWTETDPGFTQYRDNIIKDLTNTEQHKTFKVLKNLASLKPEVDFSYVDQVISEASLPASAETILGVQFAKKQLGSTFAHVTTHLPESLLVKWEGFTLWYKDSSVTALYEALKKRKNISLSLVQEAYELSKKISDNNLSHSILTEILVEQVLKQHTSVDKKIACINFFAFTVDKLVINFLKEDFLEKVEQMRFSLVKQYAKENNLENVPEEWVFEMIKAF